ncbi:enolase C-terminal domain-like protein [Cupriavidus taiwanensis]|uniref:enolase C-terminal domain-like protein n=1 Tax=Cupriavidus taiwanensis TaxID=164546 RepID=UPI0039C4174B
MDFEPLTYQSVEVRAVLIPLNRPIISKVGAFDQWPLILVDLHTREGVVGRSYLEPYLIQAPRYIVPAIRDLAASRAGSRIAPLDDFQNARGSTHLLGYEGITMIAIAGLDMAAWDALGKAAGLPLAALLGGTVGSVQAYNSNGLWLSHVDGVAEEASSLVAEGAFSALKLRLGREKLQDDLDAIRAVREAAGDEIKLMVDFNQGLSFDDGLRRCHALDNKGLYWFEEPLAYNNTSGHARLAREIKTPIQLGENFYGPRELLKAVQAEACDCVMLDMMRIGGVSGWLRSAPIASAAGIPVSTHLYPEVCAHLMRITETAHWLEWQDWAYPVLREPFALADGHLVVPDRPGSGIEWDESVVKRFQYD